MFMHFDRNSRAARVCLFAAMLLTACGRDAGSKDDAASNDSVAAQAADAADPAAEAPAAAPPSPSDGASAPLTTADIDRWQRGMAGELDAVHAAAGKLKAAKTGEDTLNAMMGVQEMNTVAAGAKAAGVEEERYKVIRSNLSAAVAYLTPELGGIDTTMLSPAQRAELKQGNETQLKQMESTVPPDVVEALRPRAAALRKQDLELVGARLKGSGM
jgi:hypothetical protein